MRAITTDGAEWIHALLHSILVWALEGGNWSVSCTISYSCQELKKKFHGSSDHDLVTLTSMPSQLSSKYSNTNKFGKKFKKINKPNCQFLRSSAPVANPDVEVRSKRRVHNLAWYHYWSPSHDLPLIFTLHDLLYAIICGRKHKCSISKQLKIYSQKFGGTVGKSRYYCNGRVDHIVWPICDKSLLTWVLCSRT